MTSTVSRAGLARSVSLAALIMAGSNVLSRLLGVLRELLLAHLVGTSWTYDAYIFAFTLPELINHFAAASALSIPFIPLFQKHLSAGRDEQAWRFFSNLLTVGTVILSVFIVVCMRYTGAAFSVAGANINDPSRPELMALAVRLTRIVLPAQLFFFWGALLNGVQYAHRRFLVPALMPLLYNAGIIVGGVLLFRTAGVEGFAWGVVAGAFVGNVVVQIPGALRVGMRFRPRISIGERDLLAYLAGVVPLVVGFSMANANEVLFRVFGSFAPEGEGALASLNYSLRVTLMVVGVFGQAVATGAYPFVSQMAVEGRFAELNRLVNATVRRIAALAVPVSAVMFVLSEQIVTALYQHGRFGVESTRMTARALSFYLLGAFFNCGALITNRLYYAVGNTLYPMVVSTGSVIVVTPLFIQLGRTMGVGGIALSGSIAMSLQFIVIYGSWSVWRGNDGARSVALKLAGMVAASAAGALATWGLRLWLSEAMAGIGHVLWRNLGIAALAGIPGLLFTYAAIEVTGLDSVIATARSALNRRRGKAAA